MISLSSRNLGQFLVRCVVYSVTLQVADTAVRRIGDRLRERKERKSDTPN